MSGEEGRAATRRDKMAKFGIAIAIIWALGSVGVPALQSWDLPGSNVASANAVAALEVK
jgi:hypothetical protein